MLVPFSKFPCLLQGMDRYFDEMCGNSQPQMSVFWVFNYRKNEINSWKTWRLALCHDMTSPCPGKIFEKVWLMSSCTPFINKTITEEVPCFRKGNPQDWRGIQIFFVLCPGVFFYDEHTPCKSPCSNLAFFRAHLPYLGDYVHFLGI